VWKSSLKAEGLCLSVYLPTQHLPFCLYIAVFQQRNPRPTHASGPPSYPWAKREGRAREGHGAGRGGECDAGRGKRRATGPGARPGAGPGLRGPGGARPPRHATTTAADVFAGATGQLSGIWLGQWASAKGGAAQSASMFIAGKLPARGGPRGRPSALRETDTTGSGCAGFWRLMQLVFVVDLARQLQRPSYVQAVNARCKPQGKFCLRKHTNNHREGCFDNRQNRNKENSRAVTWVFLPDSSRCATCGVMEADLTAPAPPVPSI